MAYGALTVEYSREKNNYDKYLKRSKIIRYLEIISNYMLFAGILIVFLLGFSGFSIVPINKPEFTINYLFPMVAIMSMFGGFIGLIVVTNIHNKIKVECSYEIIKLDFIYAYESLSSYDSFLRSNILLDKNDAINNLDKSLEIIKTWDYGNIPFIYNKNKIYIDFIKNEFKVLLIQMINSKEDKEITESRTLLFNFCEFLLYKNVNLLKIFYDNAIKNKEEEYILEWEITSKDRIGIYIKNHQVITQLLFSGVLLISIYYLGKNMEATVKEMMPWLITTFGISFVFFNWIKDTLFQLG